MGLFKCGPRFNTDRDFKSELHNHNTVYRIRKTFQVCHCVTKRIQYDTIHAWSFRQPEASNDRNFGIWEHLHSEHGSARDITTALRVRPDITRQHWSAGMLLGDFTIDQPVLDIDASRYECLK
eukprot:m.574292 g.574292  ORF g.574292 m.574292 type:complete len:123 (-) comp22279_c0_seq60:985-1353(-)